MVPISRPTIVLAFLAVSLLVPAGSAHSVTQELEVESRLLMDEGEDGLAVVDGHDLWDLLVREVDTGGLGAGVVFRFVLYTDFSPARAAEALHIDLGFTGPDGERTYRISTENAREWMGDGTVMDVLYNPGEISDTMIQWFMPYNMTGGTIGDDLSGFWMRSYADDQLVDAAPGGLYVAGEVEVPTESVRLNETITLNGPGNYTATNITTSPDGAVDVTVANPFGTAAQHVDLKLTAPGAWLQMREHVHNAPLEPGDAYTFQLVANPPAEPSSAAIVIQSDLGGLERWTVLWDGEALWAVQGVALPPQPEPVEPAESPAFGFVAVLVALAGLLVRRRA